MTGILQGAYLFPGHGGVDDGSRDGGVSRWQTCPLGLFDFSGILGDGTGVTASYTQHVHRHGALDVPQMAQPVAHDQLIREATAAVEKCRGHTIFTEVLSITTLLDAGQTEWEDADPAVAEAAEYPVAPFVRHSVAVNSFQLDKRDLPS